MASNYPADIGNYNNDPRSPYCGDPCESCRFDGDCDIGHGEGCYKKRESIEELLDSIERCRTEIMAILSKHDIAIIADEFGDIQIGSDDLDNFQPLEIIEAK